MRNSVIYAELREFRTEVGHELGRLNERVDRVNERIDNVIDSIAQLRREFDRHTHD
jgi:hypothetical protein